MVNIRDYEVSIWTLQDSFITVLKQSNLENREKIQEPKMVLKDDGDNSFSFKIPMYLKEDTDLSEQPYIKNESIWKENPIWYTVRNGNLISSLRKIKVIFNKGTSDEEVFEFIINNIKESHEGYSKFCEVECGGLAFHELGKQGYNITLSADEYNTDYQEWLNENPRSEENKPINNIDYWIKKVLDNSNWAYEICMDWSLYDGITTGDRSSARQANKVYREPYISSWEVKENENKLSPASSITDFNELEKRAIVNGSESNRYNLLQTIAEAFQVFCKFKYEYDDNYHITGRKVIFYNNFIKESESEKVIDFNYGYNTSQITREMDGTDLVSKMYVKPLSNSGTFYGEVNLSDTDANPSLENYLLNFNYLYKIGTISQEQYDEIPEFQKELRRLNLSLNEENKKLMNCEAQIPIEKAKSKTADDIVKQAGERIEEATNAIGAISEEDGLIHFDNNNPRPFVIIRRVNSNRCYINIMKDWQGFVPSSFNLYKNINANNGIDNSSVKITGIDFEKDDNGLITKVTFPDTGLQNNTSVYATFSYNPYTPDKVVLSIWSKKQEQAKKDAEAATNKSAELEGLKATCENKIKEYSTEKQELINKFERIMGPALREGTWQPEDEYVDYHSDKIFTVLCSANSSLLEKNNETDETAYFIWRSSLGNKYGELENSYAYGINDIRYYPCINLEGILNTETLSSLNNENLNLVYRDPYLANYTDNNPRTDPRVNHYLRAGADNGCQFAFLKNKDNGSIIPVLMVLGVDLLIDTKVGNNTITPENQIKSAARLSIISYNGGTISEAEIMGKSSPLPWLEYLADYEIVYPSFKISADRYLSTTPEHKVYQGTNPLEEYEDYYAPIFNDGEYLITLKPEKVLFNLSASYSFYYSISTAAEAMYLDAIEVLRENSVPKVSYSMTPLAIEQSLMKNAYARLGQLAHINDQELKFENVQGYISEVDLDLDKPWEDTYVIKNYKTKFEDLFSTIVAQTEAMKKNSQLFNMVSNAFNSNGLLDNALIDDIKNRLDFYVPTPAEIYSQYEPQIRRELREAFTEAGEVLAAAQSSVNDVNNLNIVNAGILGTFVENIKENMTPTIFKGDSRSSVDFKVGDIWEKGNNVYLATQNSSQIQYSSGENKLTSLKGWSLTQDGRLAGITGASIDIDSKAGNISLKAANKIEILAKTQLDLSSEDIFITGNNSVNIGSKWVNIAGTNGGINIVTSNIDTSTTKNNDGTVSGTSALKLNKDGIIIASSAEITIKSAKGINIYSSDSANTSALKINRTDGIFMGSTLPIIFYSGGTDKTMNGAASAKITSERILFGVSDGSTGTAVDLTKNYIVFGAGNVVNGNNVSNIGNKGTSGVQITKDFIRLATGDSSTTSYIGMDKNGIIISNQTSSYSGGLVKINQNGIIIGTASSNSVNGIDTTTDKNNIKNDTTPRTITSSMATFQVYAPNFVVDADGHLYAYDADIAGTIRSTSGYIGGWTLATNRLYSGSGTEYVGLDSNTDNTFAIWAGSASPTTSNYKFAVTRAGKLYAKDAVISGTVYANSGSFTGDITANSLQIGELDVSDINGFIDNRINNNTNVTTGTSRAKVFTGPSNPAPPYKIGDIWVQGKTGEIKYCITSKPSGASFSSDDWSLASKYTDDTLADSANTLANSANTLAGTKAKINTGDIPPTSEMKAGDLFIASGGNSSYPAGRTYRYVSSSSGWVAISAGVVRGTSLNVDPDTGTINMTATNTINIATNKKLSLVTNGVCEISGSAGVTIGSGSKITISSGGTFNVTSNNFIINSAASSQDPIMFKVGNPPISAGLSYSVTDGLSVNGSINTKSGTIGGWTITEYYIGSANYKSKCEVGLANPTNNDSYAFWAGGDIRNPEGADLHSAKFFVRKNGDLYANSATLQGTISLPSSDRWEGVLNNDSFWLHQTKAESDAGNIAEEAGVRIAYNNYDITLGSNTNINMMWGMSLYNVPFNMYHLRAFDGKNQTYESQALLTKGRMEFKIKYDNNTANTHVYNVFVLNSQESGGNINLHDIVLISNQHNLYLQGQKIYLTGEIYINGTKIS